MRSRPATPIRTQAHEGFSPLRDSRILAGPSNSRIVPMTASIRLLAGAVVLAVLVPALVCAQPAKTATKAPALASASEAKGIAADDYVFTYPLLQTYRELDRQMNQADAVDYVGQWNAFRHQDSLPGPKDATIRGRSYDAPLSWAWLDVRAEPVVVDIPAVPAARYVVFQFWDLWGHNLEHVGTKTAAGKATRVLVAGPAFKGSPPKGIDRVVRSSASLNCNGSIGSRRGRSLRSGRRSSAARRRRSRVGTIPKRAAPDSSVTSMHCCRSSRQTRPRRSRSRVSRPSASVRHVHSIRRRSTAASPPPSRPVSAKPKASSKRRWPKRAAPSIPWAREMRSPAIR